MIQLDTGFLIRAMVKGSPEATSLRHWLRNGEMLGISAPAWAEFLCKPVTLIVVAIAGELLGAPVPFTATEAEISARLYNDAGRRRGSLLDCMIAATAINAGHRLATTNPADFTRFTKFGLALQ